VKGSTKGRAWEGEMGDSVNKPLSRMAHPGPHRAGETHARGYLGPRVDRPPGLGPSGFDTSGPRGKRGQGPWNP
jgi:hypothetical protein